MEVIKPLAEFKTDEWFILKTRGIVFIVDNIRDCEDFGWLTKKWIKINDQLFQVAGVESHAIPFHHIGDKIGILVTHIERQRLIN